MDNQTLKIDEKLTQRKYNPDHIPSQDQIIFSIQNKHIGAIQNFIVVSGLPKSGKSTFLAAAIASAFIPGDIFGMKINFPVGRRKLAYFDTESSDYDFYRQIQKIKNFSGLNGLPEWADCFTVREDSPQEIRALIMHYLETNPECPVIIIDGLLDLIFDYNSEVESRKLVNWFKKLTKLYNCLFIGVLHQGKGMNTQTLGHLGSNTDRWAQSTVEIIKDKDKKTYTMQPRFLRSSDDFEPIVLMNFDGNWQQMNYEGEKQKDQNKKPKDFTEMEHKALLWQVLKDPVSYKELIEELQERTGKGLNYSKEIVKIWIAKNYIRKNAENNYLMV
jgi:hypothetical protein